MSESKTLSIWKVRWMPDCPICRTPTAVKRESTPYFICGNCSLWFQSPMPPKVWHGPHETWVGKPMSEQEKGANKMLADWLFKDVLSGKVGHTLDIGCWLPVLAGALADHGCQSFAIDWDDAPGSHSYTAAGGSVSHIQFDFEQDDLVAWCNIQPDYPTPKNGRFNLLTMVHTFEHLYNPIAALKKCRTLLSDNGALFIRMPDHGVNGFERDLTDGHYQIHGYFHCFQSILELCAQTGLFTIGWTAMLAPGQRDLVLRPV